MVSTESDVGVVTYPRAVLPSQPEKITQAVPVILIHDCVGTWRGVPHLIQSVQEDLNILYGPADGARTPIILVEVGVHRVRGIQVVVELILLVKFPGQVLANIQNVGMGPVPPTTL